MKLPDDRAYRYLYNENKEPIIRVGVVFDNFGKNKIPHVSLVSEKRDMSEDEMELFIENNNPEIAALIKLNGQEQKVSKDGSLPLYYINLMCTAGLNPRERYDGYAPHADEQDLLKSMEFRVHKNDRTSQQIISDTSTNYPKSTTP